MLAFPVPCSGGDGSTHAEHLSASPCFLCAELFWLSLAALVHHIEDCGWEGVCIPSNFGSCNSWLVAGIQMYENGGV